MTNNLDDLIVQKPEEKSNLHKINQNDKNFMNKKRTIIDLEINKGKKHLKNL
mgnify:CR=1 FL=1